MEKRFFNTTASVSICAHLSQPPQSTGKPLLLFLHYWGGSSSTWCKLTSPESPTSLATLFPLLALDLRGWGESKHIQAKSESTGDYSVQAMASDIASILLELNQDSTGASFLENGVVLVGHSMGAKVALASLAAMTSATLDLVKGLVLVAPAPPITLDLPQEMKAQQQIAYESAESVRWTVENVLANTDKLDTSDMELTVQSSLSGNATAKKAWPSHGMQEDFSSRLHDVFSASHVPIKVKVLVGALDVVEPQDRVQTQVVDFLQRNGAEVSLRVVPGVKHLIPLEDAQAIFQEICQL